VGLALPIIPKGLSKDGPWVVVLVVDESLLSLLFAPDERAGLGIKEVLDSAVEAACDVLGTDGAAIGLLDGDYVTLRSHRGLSDKFTTRFRVPKDESFTGLVFESGQPYASKDMSDDAHGTYKGVWDEGIKGAVVIPLKICGQVIGCLYVGYCSPHEFTDGEIRIAGAFGEQVSKSLENACLLEQERRERERAESLLAVAGAASPGLSLKKVVIKICQAVLKLSVADRCSIFLRNEESGRSEPYMSIGLEDPDLWKRFQESGSVSPKDVQGLERAWRTLTPTVEEHVPGSRFLPDYWVKVFGIKSLAVYPLIVRDKPVGAMTVDSFRDFVRFPPEEIEVLTAVAQQIAVMIDNARLFEQERRQRERAERLLEVVSAAAPNLSLKQVVIKICQAVVKLSVAERCSIFLFDEKTWRAEPYMSLGVEDPELWERFQGAAGLGPDEVRGLDEKQSTLWRKLLDTKRKGPQEVPELAQVVEAPAPVIEERVPGSGLLPDFWINTFALKSVAIYPLNTRQRPVGAMVMDSFHGFVHFPPEEIEILTAIAGQIAIVIENARLYEKVQAQAVTDFLTGIYNHRYLRDRLDEEVARTNRGGLSFSIMMLDLDGFARFNNTYGHPAGDAVLRNVASGIATACRATDIVGRYGGDEFLVILPQTNKTQAKRVAKRIQAGLAKECFAVGEDGAEVSVTVSIGIAGCPEDGDRGERLILAADTALYESKHRGGNHIIVCGRPKDGSLPSRSSALAIIQGLASALGEKEPYSRGRHFMTVRYAGMIADALSLSEADKESLRAAALLHDVGNLTIPDRVLLKEGPLNKREWPIVRKHVLLGETILRGVPELEDAAAAVISHHERWDGSGYPHGLRGEDIPLLGRILAIVDAFSAMICDRPYRKALSRTRAMRELKANAGKQFDPRLVNVFLEAMKKEDASERDEDGRRAA
jgi:diguanylate cyclase (GGDEF)-like protein